MGVFPRGRIRQPRGVNAARAGRAIRVEAFRHRAERNPPQRWPHRRHRAATLLPRARRYAQLMATGDDPRSDAQLIDAINAGDAGAFDTLYRRYRDWVVNLAYRFTHHRDDAIDAMQETFLYVLRKFPGFELTARFKTFLYPVVKHTAIELRDRRRRSRGEGSEALTDVADPATAEPAEATDDLLALLEKLGEPHREAVILRFVEGLSVEEIAEATGVPAGTIKSRLHHAVAKMRDSPTFRDFFEKD